MAIPIGDFLSILQRMTGRRARRGGPDKWTATCPAHKDHRPSLSVRFDSATGNILIKCHAGCDWRDVLDCLHLDRNVLCANRATPRPARPPQPVLDHLAHAKVSARGKLAYLAIWPNRASEGKVIDCDDGLFVQLNEGDAWIRLGPPRKPSKALGLHEVLKCDRTTVWRTMRELRSAGLATWRPAPGKHGVIVTLATTVTDPLQQRPRGKGPW